MATSRVNTSRFLAKGGGLATADNPGGMSVSKVSRASPVNKNMPTAKRPTAGTTAGQVSSKSKVSTKGGNAGFLKSMKPVNTTGSKTAKK